MAWPRTRILDFISRQTKIPATFLNALQDWTNALTLGTVSVKALVIDTVGGDAAALADGLHVLFDADNFVTAVLGGGGDAQLTVAGPAGVEVVVGSGKVLGPDWGLESAGLQLPDSVSGGSPVLTGGLIPMAWGHIRVAVGGAITAVGEGFVTASTALVGQQIKVVLTTAPNSPINLSIHATHDASVGLAAGWTQIKKSNVASTDFFIELYGSGGSIYDPASAGGRVDFVVFGRV